MTKAIVHEFVSHIYPRRLFIVKGNIPQEWLNSQFRVEFTNVETFLRIDEDDEACVYNNTVRYLRDGNLGVLLLMKGRLTNSEIAHESVHAAAELFEQLGCDFDYANQEPFAYLVGWCADCIDQVNKNKFKD